MSKERCHIQCQKKKQRKNIQDIKSSFSKWGISPDIEMCANDRVLEERGKKNSKRIIASPSLG